MDDDWSLECARRVVKIEGEGRLLRIAAMIDSFAREHYRKTWDENRALEQRMQNYQDLRDALQRIVQDGR